MAKQISRSQGVFAGGDVVPGQERDAEEFGATWSEPPDLLPIGGKWIYAVGLVKERGSGMLRLRIAKGPVKGYTKRNPKGVLEAFPNDPLDPLAQPNRLNLKTVEEWEQITKLVKKWLSKLPAARPQHPTPEDKPLKESYPQGAPPGDG
jgi:hypothetical protein